MDPKDKNKTNSTDTFKLVKSKDAKSVLSLDSIDKLQNAVDKLDEIEKEYTEEDIQKSLMANNYEAPKEEETVPPVEEDEEETNRISFKELFNELKEKFIVFIKNLSVKTKRILYGVLTVIVIILFVLFVRYEKKIHTYKMILNGDEVVSLYEGGLYREKGVEAYNYKGESKNGLIKIDAQVDTDVVGEYYVKYTINSFWKKNEVTRKVIVLPNPLDNIYFTLNGDDEVEVKLGSKYEDEGYSIRSDDDKDYTKYVTTTNNVNTKKIGSYEVKYLIKINKKQQELIRKVNVVGDRYSINYNKAATKGNVEVNVVSNILDFDYFMVDGHKVLKDNIIYTVTDNGTYDIEMYDTNGNKDNISIKIGNIDREPPTGTCQAWMSSQYKNTRFNLNIKDASEIKSYKYNGEVFSTSTFYLDSLKSSGNVEVVDAAGNSANITCNYLYSPIMSDGSNNVILRFDGSTMKYWVEKPTGTYVVTHIWVEDPYNQFKVAIPKKFPQLERAGNIMNIASNKYGYYSKAMIGANASGFVSDGFNTEIAKRYPAWKYSSKSPIVIVDGVVLRNYSSYNMKDINAFTYGMASNGYLVAYYTTSSDKNNNIKNAQKIIDSGVKYTFGFSPVLIHNGKISENLSVIPDIRQGIGQIDKNNFIIVTNTVGIGHRPLGLSFRKLASIMYDYGCKEAYNTDGGGSTNLIYKNRNTNNYSGIVTTTRDVADIMYFVEK